jgi:PAS domain S-box-containing protein
MMPLTAVACLASAVALWLLSDGGAGPRRRLAGQALGFGIAALSAVILLEYLTGWSAGIDRALFSEKLGPQAYGYPGRPSPQSAAGFLLAGLALGLIDTDSRRRVRPATVLTILTFMVGMLALLGIVYGVPYRGGISLVTGMSVHSALGVLAVSIGLVLIRPQRQPMLAFLSTGPGGMLARRLAPVFVLLPVGLGLLSAFAGSRSGLGSPALAVTLTAATSMLVLTWVLARTVRVLDDNDRAQNLLTDTLREERDFTATLLRSLEEGVLVVDPSGRILAVNPRWCTITGFRGEDLVGLMPPYPWWSKEEKQELGSKLATILETAAVATEERLVHRSDGTSTSVIATIAPVPGPGGRPRAYVATYTDIIDRKRVEKDLAEHAAALAAANSELQRANTGLANENQFKSDVMAMLSHEMRQPLTTITGFAELIAEDPAVPELTHAHAARIMQGTERLGDLLNNLLLTFRLDAGTIAARRTIVDVSNVAAQAIAAMPAKVEVRTHIEPDVKVLADAGHVRQILTNLLTNAVKYGASPITVEIYRTGHTVAVSVRDHGHGVPPEFVPRLFERFTRATGPAMRSVQGSGLGMFIVRELAHANDATISYEPAQPGARFTLTLMLAPEPVGSRD